MCHEGDWLLVVWMLKSLARVVGELPPLVIHLQRLPRPSALVALKHHFPDARLVLPEESVPMVSEYLATRRFTRCQDWLWREPILNKLVTLQVVATSTNIIWVDSDVLFFNRPEEFLRITNKPLDRIYFQEDCTVSFTLTPEQALQELGISITKRINAGLLMRSRESIRLEKVEELLGNPLVGVHSGLIDQTLQALCASADGTADNLPKSYAIQLEEDIDPSKIVCRHYAGPTRAWITTQGMRWLIQHGILQS
jgi:lipopolysaccharide biosynthesis glycosyltransferase